MFLCGLVSLKGGASDAGVVSGVIGADVIPKEGLKLMQGMDLIKVKPVEEPFPHGPEVSFHLGFGGAVPDRRVQEHGADGAADQGELLIDVGGAVVGIKPVRDAVGGDGLFQHFLETVGIVAVGEACADNHAGMVVDDDDQIDLMGLFICGIVDVTEVAGIGLPEPAKGILLKGFPVLLVQFPWRFQAVVPDETLHGVHADTSRDEAVLYKADMDLGGIQARVFFFQAQDLFDRRIRQSAGDALVGTGLWQEGIEPAFFIEVEPFLRRLPAVLHASAVRQGKRFLCDAHEVSRIASIGNKPLHERGNERETELGGLYGSVTVGRLFWVVFLFFHEKTSFFVVPFMIKEALKRVDSQAVAERAGVCGSQTGSFTVRRVFV